MQFPSTPSSVYAVPAPYINLDDVVVWEKQSTTIPGLKFLPKLISTKFPTTDPSANSSEALNARDGGFPTRQVGPFDPVLNRDREFSKLDQDVIGKYLKELVAGADETPLVIVEIGVNRQVEEVDPIWGVSRLTSTIVLLENKRPQDIYIGIDIEDKSYFQDPTRNVYTIQSDSADHAFVRSKFDMLGITKIDYLFIDGWHSVNQVIEEWKYTDLLSTNGIVAMHDTNSHLGPYLLMEAIDTDMYEVRKYLSDIIDYGIGIAIRK